MIPSSLDWLGDALVNLDQQGLLRRLANRDTAQTAEVSIDGRRLINFGANDYLGLAADPRLGEAACSAIEQLGWGSGASPLVSGRSHFHAELEQAIADFEATEAALVFPSGFAANAGTIPALVGEGDVILADAGNHASLIDGCRLAKAARLVYPHGDWRSLESLLADTGRYRRRLIVTDSLFSMDGDLAPLVEIGRLADEHNAMLLVDEAHATGVWGARGRGVVEHLAADVPQLEQQVAVRVGTLSKAIGASGGFVAGSRLLIEWLANTARSYVFSTASEAASAAAATKAFEIVRDEPHRRTELLTRAANLRQTLAQRGWDLSGSASQIIPLVVGDERRTMELALRLRDQGIYVPGIRPPTVPPGTSRLRISLSYLHTDEQIERLVDAVGRPSSV